MKTKTLGELGEVNIGLTYSPEDVAPYGTRVLRSSNIQDGRLSLDDSVFVTSKVPDNLLVKAGDILICVRNGSRSLIGKSVRLDNRVTGDTFGAFMAVFRSPINDFLIHYFRSDFFKSQVDEHLGATINQITNGSFKNFTVKLPDRSAQRAIAGALSDVDSLSLSKSSDSLTRSVR